MKMSALRKNLLDRWRRIGIGRRGVVTAEGLLLRADHVFARRRRRRPRRRAIQARSGMRSAEPRRACKCLHDRGRCHGVVDAKFIPAGRRLKVAIRRQPGAAVRRLSSRVRRAAVPRNPDRQGAPNAIGGSRPCASPLLTSRSEANLVGAQGRAVVARRDLVGPNLEARQAIRN